MGTTDKDSIDGVDSISPTDTIIKSTGKYIALIKKKKNNLRGD